MSYWKKAERRGSDAPALSWSQGKVSPRLKTICQMHAKGKFYSHAEIVCAYKQRCKNNDGFSILGSLSLTDIKDNYQNRKPDARREK